MMIEILTKWQQTINETDDQIDNLRNFFGCVECDFVDAMEKLQCEYTKSVEAQLGDECGWLIWFWLDNSMGKDGMEAGYNNNLRKIKTLKHLEKLIKEGKDRD